MDVNAKVVLDYFRKICSIPRPSGAEEKIRAYLSKWAVEKGYTYVVDKTGNLIVDCDGRPGYEDKSKVILQAHMDMVCVSEEGKAYNPLDDGIDIIECGDFLQADRTSLGGDDGIGIAIAQHIADNFMHRGPLRLIFTVDEEDTMIGAASLDEKHLGAPYLINLDSEVSDKAMISSAGCMEVTGKNVPETTVAFLKNGFRVKLSGLMGGHSGDDIDKGRENGILIGAQIIHMLESSGIEWEFCGLNGGAASNAIPLNAEIIGNTRNPASMKAFIANGMEKIKAQYPQEKNLTIAFEETPAHDRALDKVHMTEFLSKLPNGILAMSGSIEGLVGISSNLGVFRIDENCMHYKLLIRGEVENDILDVAEKIEVICRNAGIPCEKGQLTPSWPADSQSRLLSKMQDAYKAVTGAHLEPIAVHAGLECAEFRAKNSEIEMVSISPDVYDAHSVRERLYIPSVGKIINVLETLLEGI